MRDITGNQFAANIVPWSRADAIARIDGRLAGTSLRAQVGAPCPISRTHVCSQPLAVYVCPDETAEVTAVTDRLARDKKRHGRGVIATRLRKRRNGTRNR